MKKFISTSLAFLCIMTSSASFPNQLSAVESKSNVKFYLKSASNIVSDILCTILPAFIASAIFKSRAESPISIIPDNDNIPLSSNPSLPTTEINQRTISDSKEEKEEIQKNNVTNFSESRSSLEENNEVNTYEERQKEEEERKKQEEEEEKKSSTATNQTSVITCNNHGPLSSSSSLLTTEISQSTISDSKEEKQKQEEKEKRIETNIQTIKKQQEEITQKLSTAIDNKNLELSRVQKELEALEEITQKLSTAIDNKNLELSRVQKELEELQQNEVTSNLVSEMVKQINNINIEIKNLETSKLNLDKEIENLKTSKLSLDTEIGNLETSKSSLDTEIEDLEISKLSLDTEIENLETSKHNLNTENLEKKANNVIKNIHEINEKITNLIENTSVKDVHEKYIKEFHANFLRAVGTNARLPKLCQFCAKDITVVELEDNDFIPYNAEKSNLLDNKISKLCCKSVPITTDNYAKYKDKLLILNDSCLVQFFTTGKYSTQFSTNYPRLYNSFLNDVFLHTCKQISSDSNLANIISLVKYINPNKIPDPNNIYTTIYHYKGIFYRILGCSTYKISVASKNSITQICATGSHRNMAFRSNNFIHIVNPISALKSNTCNTAVISLIPYGVDLSTK